ncbi:MAG: hypothetical protein LBV79_06775 [Candidatus Adiutrix sp.]|nr:hypothetical protein [Candidatus Adiutrix sp.]
MCHPVAFAVASAVASAASKFVEYRQQTKAAKASADYNAAIAADQAEVSKALARNEIAKGDADRERAMRASARQMGEMRSQLGASGFEMDSGSGLSLLAESAQEQQYDANIITNNAATAAWQHEANANSALNNQSWYKYQRQQSKGSALAVGLGVGGSILGGIGGAMAQHQMLKGG